MEPLLSKCTETRECTRYCRPKLSENVKLHKCQKHTQNHPSTLRGQDKPFFVFYNNFVKLCSKFFLNRDSISIEYYGRSVSNNSIREGGRERERGKEGGRDRQIEREREWERERGREKFDTSSFCVTCVTGTQKLLFFNAFLFVVVIHIYQFFYANTTFKVQLASCKSNLIDPN